MKTAQSLNDLQRTGDHDLSVLNNLSRRAGSVLAFVFLCVTASLAQKDPVDWVNLYIGTGSGPIGYGGTMPFVTPPFGMTDWTPQTRQNKISVVSYKYEDTDNFRLHRHSPAGNLDGRLRLCDFDAGDRRTQDDSRRPQNAFYAQHDEIVRPDYYSVSMNAGEFAQDPRRR